MFRVRFHYPAFEEPDGVGEPRVDSPQTSIGSSPSTTGSTNHSQLSYLNQSRTMLRRLLSYPRSLAGPMASALLLQCPAALP